jgi:hypothetical protein
MMSSGSNEFRHGVGHDGRPRGVQVKKIRQKGESVALGYGIERLVQQKPPNLDGQPHPVPVRIERPPHTLAMAI